MFKRMLVAVVLLASTLAIAQTASISGVVTDSSGAVVSGAEIVVKAADTGAVRSATSEASGTFSVPSLAVGKYRVEVNKEGFATFRVSEIVLTVDQALTINPILKAGGSTEVVEVNGASLPPVDLESSQISNLIEQQQMVSLPLITRDPYSLILLSPGTSTAQNGMGGISVNGGRSRNNNFLLDGVDNNDTSVPGGLGGVLNANPDSTQEFRVITDTFNAEFGRNTGAIVDVVTRSGTNTLHGDAYYFGRWNGFGGARDYFNPGIGPNAGPMNPYIRHQFGFSVGGPIVKNRTFLFFNDEMHRYITTLTDSAVVPTQQFLTGKFNYTYSPCPPSGACQPPATVPIDLTPGGANNATGISFDPTMAKVFALYPTVSAAQSQNGISGLIFFPSQSRTSTYNPVLKLDHKINEKNALNVRYGYNHFFDPNPASNDILPGFGHYSEKAINYGLSAQLTSTISNTLINNFQFGLNHIYATFYLPRSTVNVLDGPGGEDSFGNGWDYSLDPFTSLASVLGGSNAQARTTGTVSYTDTVTWVKGNNTWKFGFDFRNVRESGFDNFDSRRQLLMDPLLTFGFDPGLVANEPANDVSTTLIDAANALYGLVIEDVQAQFFNKSAARQRTDGKVYRQHEFDWFGQDSWKVRSNLTINLGLRYQLNGVPYEENGNASNLFQDPGSYATGQPVVFTLVGAGTGHSLYRSDYQDIEPRVGVSWDPWRNRKTAIRAGFGIFHDRVFGNEFGNARANPPFQAEYSTFPIETINNAFGTGAFLGQPPTQVPTATISDRSLTPNLVIFDQHFRNPASSSWNLDIQRQLLGNNVLDVAYVGAAGRHVLGQRDGNPPDPNLVAQLVAYCSVPNAFNCTAFPPASDPSASPTVQSLNLYDGFDNGLLPFNAVNNNALLQPFYQITEFNSIYHGLQSKFTHRMSHGVQFQASYTWSHALDNGVDPLAPNLGARTFPRNSRNLKQSFGNSDNDVRHVFVANYIWDLPLGRGKGNLSSGLVGRILEGMQFAGIFSAQTGTPFNVRGNKDTQRTGIAAWAYQIGNPFTTGTNCAQSGGFVYMPNAQCAFSAPPWGSPSNNARNMWFGPGFWDWNMTFSKAMSITERVKAELRFEGYNVLNHTHFNNVGADGLGNLLGSGEFGVITSTATQPDGTTSARQMQVALRVSF